MAEPKLFRGEYYLWHYVPSKPAAIIFAIIFTFLTLALLWRMCRTRMWFFTAFVVGGFFELIGFAARASASGATDRLMPFVIQNTFILLAPALFAATIYMTLGRIMRLVRAEAYSLVPIRWLTKLFVTGDILSFTVQGSAAGLMATGDNAVLGQNIVIVGLFIQIVVFGFFMITAVVFHVRLQRQPTFESKDLGATWRQHVYTLYAVSTLILVRSVFRVIEFIQGYDGYLLQNEWPMYVFDAVLMVFVMAIFVAKYPADLRAESIKGSLVPLSSFDERPARGASAL